MCPSIRLPVRLYVTSRCFTKKAKRMITQTTPRDSPPGTLVFWCQRYPRNSTGVTPTGAPNAIYRMVTLPMAFVTGEPRDFKFGTLTYHSKSHPADEKSSLKGAWSGSADPFFYRAMLCIRGTSHGPVSVCLSLCLSVCPSVCLSVRHKSVFY